MASFEECGKNLEYQVRKGSKYLVFLTEDWDQWGDAILRKFSDWLRRIGYQLRPQPKPKFKNSMAIIIADKELPPPTPEPVQPASPVLNEISEKKSEKPKVVRDLSYQDEMSRRRDACLSEICGQVEGAHITLKVKASEWIQFRQDVIDFLKQPEVKRLGYQVRINFERLRDEDGILYYIFADRFAEEKKNQALAAPRQKYFCSICGYPDLEKEPSYSFEDCPCCGVTFGIDDGNSAADRFLLRLEWLRKGAPWSAKFQRPGIWLAYPLRAALDQLKKADLLVPGIGETAVSRFYEMEIIVGGLDDKSQLDKYRQVIEEEWSIEAAYLTGSGASLSAFYGGRDLLFGGESEDDFCNRVCAAIWFAAGKFIPVTIRATNQEKLPSNSFSFVDDARYQKLFPSGIDVLKVGPDDSKVTAEALESEAGTLAESADQSGTVVLTEADLVDDEATEPLSLEIGDEEDTGPLPPSDDDPSAAPHYPFGNDDEVGFASSSGIH